MSLSKICFMLAFWFTVVNLLLGRVFHLMWLAYPIIAAGDAIIFLLWLCVRVQVKR